MKKLTQKELNEIIKLHQKWVDGELENSKKHNISFALKLSIFAHKNQVDKAGVQYLYHILDVAKQATSDEEFIVALLHDFIEDAENITCQNRRIDVIRNVFDKNIFQAIIAITHLKNEKRSDYIARISKNKLATAVKRYDINSNSNSQRLLLIKDVETRNRLINKRTNYHAFFLTFKNK